MDRDQLDTIFQLSDSIARNSGTFELWKIYVQGKTVLKNLESFMEY